MTDDRWTAADMPDLTGRTVVVTGANSGLGYAATEAFARAGADVVMACRSLDRGRRAADEVRAAVPGATLEVRELDLAALSSVREFAEGFLADYGALHVLCNNAGVMALPYRETEDGFEYQMGVNHLGHFALTGHLLDRLRDTAGTSRVVTQSSGLHERGEFSDAWVHGDDESAGVLHDATTYDKWDAYGRSKLANLLFAFELDRRLKADGAEDVLSTACHPGWAATNLQARGPEEAGSRLRLLAMKAANALLAQDAEAGALPMLYAATGPAVTGGDYIGPDGFMNMRGYPTHDTPSKRARDGTLARRLWRASEDLTGVTYGLQADAAALE